MRLLKGSNQYISRVNLSNDKPKLRAMLCLFTIIIFVMYGVSTYMEFVLGNIDHKLHETFQITAYAPTKIISPLGKVYAAEIPTATPTPTQEQLIDADIKEVFGKYYPKAMLLLKGNGKAGSCHENAGLNPQATNDNTAWGGVGIDRGIFQINDTWQGVTNKAFLYDYDINIRMAWNIFVHHNYSFEAWTCGKYYHI